MMRTVHSLFLFCAAGAASTADGFSASVVARSSSPAAATTTATVDDVSSAPPRGGAPVLTTVAVTGATGRTGRLVVQELLNRGVPNVVAIVRNETKAKEVLMSESSRSDDDALTEGLSIVSCDLTNDEEILSALRNADATVWCATGFADAQPPATTTTSVPFFAKVKKLLGLDKSGSDNETKASTSSRKSIDLIGLPVVAKCMLEKQQDGEPDNSQPATTTPRVVMLSSAGVTRPTWDDKKKSLLSGAADIPIVRLNPFGILDVKRQSEEALRASGVPYCIVRPAGLNDDWPAGSRPVLSQGDVAVGRINRADVAKIVVEALLSPDATGKTFEAISVAGYPGGGSAALGQAMARLSLDSDGAASSSFDSVYATYSAMQQLLPGEKQDSAALAMGQTYEQLDKGVTGRFGRRGEENAEAAAPKPTS